MWAIPPVWFLMPSVGLLIALTVALYATWKSIAADDAEWERQRRRLHSLNRPIFPARNLPYYPLMATASVHWSPGAVWPVSDHGDVSSYG